jgi:carbamoyl-phosphate synthase large subunit
MSIEDVYELTGIDPWFLDNLHELVEVEDELRSVRAWDALPADLLRTAKRCGFSDRQLAQLYAVDEFEVRRRRKAEGIVATFKSVDTCAAEFEAYTPYYYSTYESEDEVPAKPAGGKRIVILGGGPNRIGQGIEFDYCCCHASFAMRELSRLLGRPIESVMVNSNPETVSTDYDTSDLLFFEPLTVEDVLNICDRVEPDGVIVQFGGQTPLNLARRLADAGVPIIGTSVDAIEDAEDREKFQHLLVRLGLKQPPSGIARNLDQARREAAKIGFPLLVRPSFVLGGRAMEICYDEEQLERFAGAAFRAAQGQPVLIDRFLEGATEVDVDAVCDGSQVIVPGVMEHIEEAGVHSGDSACAIPPYSLPGPVVAEIKSATHALARALGVVGLMNVQFAVKWEQKGVRNHFSTAFHPQEAQTDREMVPDTFLVYVIEVNPRASRTVPFVSKAVGLPVAKIAAKAMVGVSLAEQGVLADPVPAYVSVKESVFPFVKFPGVDIVLGPEMKSTGEVMGTNRRFSIAFAKSQLAAGTVLPLAGKIFISVAERHKAAMTQLARRLAGIGFEILATPGTADALEAAGVTVQRLKKIQDGGPNLLDYFDRDEVDLVMNTPVGKGARTDEGRIRAAAVTHGVPCITTMEAAHAAVRAMEALQQEELTVQALQDRLHP